jgi:hypothetical protein
MALNQYLYMQGEVCRLFRWPLGPDSGFLLYSRHGGRRTYFDTTASAHANYETCYIVEPRPPGAAPAPNGLPLFTLYYENDDDGDRELGADSRLRFQAPESGVYLVRVSDVRGFGGERHQYRLTARRAAPDFRVALDSPSNAINAGSGKELRAAAKRLDGFEGEIRVDIDGVPAGFTVSSPLIIQAGHDEAKGCIFAAAGAVDPGAEAWAKIRIRASAEIGGRLVEREVKPPVSFKLEGKPALTVELLPLDPSGQAAAAGEPHALELAIAPGEMIKAHLRIQRHGHKERATFGIENLPHGVIVEDVGLNGVLIPEGETERVVFIFCFDWVPQTRRLAYAVCNEAGRQTTRPFLLEVKSRRADSALQASGD